MSKVIIDQGFWDIFPEAQINYLIVKGINNKQESSKASYYQNLLEDGKKQAKQYLNHETFSENKIVKEWREAFKKFKTKKGVRSSIESLLKRVDQDRDFSPINPLVDIYNSISMKYGVPLGGEDLETIVGDLHLGIAKGGEVFLPLGAETSTPALENEIIYYDQEGAICRCLNWREAQRTMLTEGTTNAILFIESINEEQAKRADDAMIELKNLIEDYYGVTCQDFTINESSKNI